MYSVSTSINPCLRMTKRHHCLIITCVLGAILTWLVATRNSNFYCTLSEILIEAQESTLWFSKVYLSFLFLKCCHLASPVPLSKIWHLRKKIWHPAVEQNDQTKLQPHSNNQHCFYYKYSVMAPTCILILTAFVGSVPIKIWLL